MLGSSVGINSHVSRLCLHRTLRNYLHPFTLRPFQRVVAVLERAGIEQLPISRNPRLHSGWNERDLAGGELLVAERMALQPISSRSSAARRGCGAVK
jgi:hypothetical protein